MSTKDAALRYAAKGWRVIPVHSVQDNGFCSCGAPADYVGSNPKHAIGKHPYLGETGHRESSNQPMQIETWWMQWPKANLSIATGAKSGLLVIDIDKKSGGIESLQHLFDRHGAFPRTPIVESGGGGLHFYFKSPLFEVRGRRGMVPGIDVQADGGRIVAPPSKHKYGTLYKWHDDYGEDYPLAKVPTWLLEMILSKQSKRRRQDPIVETEPAEVRIFRSHKFRY